eukprot:TRINITY_DN730_c0_g3_i5.p1 TRINITY_DN730_c0_g3~~TRINITY_DN730_c0_g3_i5.p1  ORF type:complete len:1055 (+),score=196.13 TRINITY_DN730_c0_g3_i5:74-3166(+)
MSKLSVLLCTSLLSLCGQSHGYDAVGRVYGSVDGLVKVELEMSQTEGDLFMSITGPSDRWFGVGLNNTETGYDAMTDTYAIIVLPTDGGDAEIQEWILGDMGSSSTQKQLSTSIKDVTKTTIGATRTVTLSRTLLGATPDHKNFTASLSDMSIIQATGSTQGGQSGKTFGPHNDNAGIYSMNFTTVVRGRVDVKGIVDFSIDVFDSTNSGTADTVAFEIMGPVNTSFSVLFGDDLQQGFSVSADGDVSEVDGDITLPPIFENLKSESKGLIQMVTFERPAVGPKETYYSFNVNDVTLNYSLTANNVFNEKGVAQIASVHQTRGSSSDSTTNVEVEIELSVVSNEMMITISGPSADSSYFAVGFGASDMSSEPWTLIVIGNQVGEYHTYQDSRSGVTPVPAGNTTVGLKVLSSSVTNGVQTVKIMRPTKNVIENTHSFDFSSGTRSLDIITSRGPVQNGEVQYHDARSSSSIPLNPVLTFYGSANYTTKNGNVMLDVLIDEITNNVTIEISGPSGHWFGVGFGGGTMETTYAIVARVSDIQERVLGDHSAGEAIPDQSISVLSDVTSNGIRTITVVRPITTGGVHFDFRVQTHSPAGGFATISAVGEGADFLDYPHGDKGFVNNHWLLLSSNAPAPSPTPAPVTVSPSPNTDAPPTPSPPPPVTPVPDQPSSGCIPSDITIDSKSSVKYDCMMHLTDLISYHWKFESRTNVSYFAVQNAAPGWVGVAVAEHCDFMVPGRGVIGTHSSQDTYLIQAKGGPNAVVVDHSQIVSNMTGSLENGITTLRWSKKVSDNPVINPNIDTCFNYATHESDALGYHGPGPAARGSFKVNLATGSAASSSSGLKSKRVIHGVLMIAAWSWLIPLGILLKRYGKPVFQLGISQFYGHIAVMMLGVILTISSYILATSSGFGSGKYSHGTIGTAVLILACSNPLVGVCGYVFVRDPKHPKRWIFNLTHLLIGRGVYVLAIVQCFFGIETISAIEGVSRAPYLVAVIFGFVASIITFFGCESIRRRASVENSIQKTIPTETLLE